MAIKDFFSKNLPVSRDGVNQPFLNLQQEMNRMFSKFYDDFHWSPFQERNLSLFPKVDIKETKSAVTVSAELPGLDAKDIDISVSDDRLTLRGEKGQEKESKEENYYRMERSYGSFHRSITLPAEVESENIEATFKNGVLTISIPKRPEGQRKTKKIKINTG